jgi:hypothetical protein
LVGSCSTSLLEWSRLVFACIVSKLSSIGLEKER